jgi:hypothetical protein
MAMRSSVSIIASSRVTPQIGNALRLGALGVGEQLKTQEDRLDTPYLDEWARRLGVSELLAKARAEATE